MRTSHSSWRLRVLALTVVLATAAPASTLADTLLSSFEGDLTTSVGVDWAIIDAQGDVEGDQLWTSEFVSDGVTDGTMALEVTQPVETWGHGLRLETTALIPIVASSDTLEFDITPPPTTIWRAVWVIMQGDGMNWTQAKQVDAPGGVTTHAILDLTMPDPDDPSKNWKAGAAASGGQWWQLWIAAMGNDSTGEVSTVIDNIRFVGGSTLTADFDDSGVVDAADLARWKTSFGTDALGDADGDSDSDGNDFLAWQRELNVPAPIVGAVPEPASGTLCGSMLVAATMFARRLAARRRAG